MFYIKVPISIFDEKRETYTGNGFMDSHATILKSSIESWFPRRDERDIEVVEIRLKSGNSYTALCSEKEFERILTKTHSYVTIDQTPGSSN